MQLNPYVMFNGQCEAALKFYEKSLGGKTAFKMTYGESPEAKDCSAGVENLIMHARFEVNGMVLMVSDAPPERYQKPQGFFVSLSIEKPPEAEHVFHALSEKGTVIMPIAETFWAQRFGMLVDQFGIPWMVNCEKSEYKSA
jgi:PhnB protein